MTEQQTTSSPLTEPSSLTEEENKEGAQQEDITNDTDQHRWSKEQIDKFVNAAILVLDGVPSTYRKLMVEEQKEVDEGTNKFAVTKDNKRVTNGRKDTPMRFAKAMMELLEGELYTNDEIVEMFKDKVFTQPTTTPLTCKWDDIHTFSFCEHHIMLMSLTISISLDYKNIKTDEDGSYVKVIGLSKIPRICELVSKRLQLQERIATDIKYIVEKLLGVPVLVHIEGKHGCVSARGAKKDILFTTDI